ncbi:hypothetical protein Aglo01_43060 [Actinokineospora globicatena]|nr:hypothetical protein Aglo01_43060 [Actinokineospora globicatena]GLW85765.1 hypothetical protein Aglo02_34050 [Actinokineospora globicatena]
MSDTAPAATRSATTAVRRGPTRSTTGPANADATTNPAVSAAATNPVCTALPDTCNTNQGMANKVIPVPNAEIVFATSSRSRGPRRRTGKPPEVSSASRAEPNDGTCRGQRHTVPQQGDRLGGAVESCVD